MNILRAMVVAALAAAWLAGCASYKSLHYNWAYTPLHDARSAAFQQPSGGLEYRRLDSFEAMAEAERDMYRKGYVMIGYSNMMSPQLEMFGATGAQELGKKYGASAVLNTFGDRHYLATLWARPKQFVFGAYFTDDLPDEARAALKEILGLEHGVIVQTVVEGSPAFEARMRPGDLVISLNGEPVRDVATMDSLLKKYAGTEVTVVVWSMEEGAPRPVAVALNRLE